MSRSRGATRAERAAQLRKVLENGPHSACVGYTTWLNAWVIPELVDLIPELRRAAAQEKAKCPNK